MTPGREGPGGDAGARLRAARLVRRYPRQWRERYGEEFTELLVSDIAERPDSLARAFDVARGGLLARLAGAGLVGCALAGPPGAGDLAAARGRHLAASLGALGAASAVFLIVGAAQWSQLLIGWVWAARPAVTLAAFPATERAWMALSPLILAIAVASAVTLVRRAGLSPRLARFEARLGLAGCVIMTAFLALCTAWLTSDGPLAGRPALFHAGWVNVASVAILAVTLLAALQASRTAARALSGG
jgi:hypothetical protein